MTFSVDTCATASSAAQPVTGLTLSDFRITEDGSGISPTESSATLLNRGQEAFVTLVLDNSPSG